MKKVTVVYPESIGTIAPEIYGHFTEMIGGMFYDGLWVGKDSPIPNIRGFRKDLIEKLKAIRPAVLRWPGGCFAESYNWRDGIGENRPKRPSWWMYKDGRVESNAVGTHEFVDLCELVGAKPYFAVNVTSITPMEARDWMDYCLSPQGSTTLALEREKNGHPEPFNIPYWGIGNENWGGGGNMTPDYYALEYRRFATVLENLCSMHGGQVIVGGANAFDYDWTDGLLHNLSHCWSTVNGMSFHYYCGGSGDCIAYSEEDWDTLLENAAKMDELIERHYAFAVANGMADRAKLVIDEWGCWHPEGSGPSKGRNLYEQQSTMRDAMVTALTLNIFNNRCHCIQMTNVAQLCNNLHALFLAGGEHCITTPTYHVFDLYKDHQGGTGLRTLVSENEEFKSSLSVSASEKDGVLTVTVANLSCRQEATFTLELLGMERPIIGVSGRLLVGASMQDHNTFDNPDTVTPANVPVDPTAPITIPKAGILALSIQLG